VKLYSRYCEPFATKKMRPDRLAQGVKMPVLLRRNLGNLIGNRFITDIADIA
jgi:hypothetical protein